MVEKKSDQNNKDEEQEMELVQAGKTVRVQNSGLENCTM